MPYASSTFVPVDGLLDEHLFVFGSLMDVDMLGTVLGQGRSLQITRLPARLPGYDRYAVAGEVFPVVAPGDGGVHGYALSGLAQEDWERVCFFEGPAYTLSVCDIELGAGERRRRTCARVFLATSLDPACSEPWDYQAWCAQDKPLALFIAAETMALYGQTACESLAGGVWDDIKARALARLAVQEMSPHAAH